MPLRSRVVVEVTTFVVPPLLAVATVYVLVLRPMVQIPSTATGSTTISLVTVVVALNLGQDVATPIARTAKTPAATRTV
jgi:hypothetical protein